MPPSYSPGEGWRGLERAEEGQQGPQGSPETDGGRKEVKPLNLQLFEIAGKGWYNGGTGAGGGVPVRAAACVPREKIVPRPRKAFIRASARPL